MQKGKRRIAVCALLWIGAAALACALFFFSGQSGADSRNVSGKITAWLLEHFPMLPFEFETLNFLLRKAAHFSFFAAEGFVLHLALCLTLARPRRAAGWSASFCAALAVLNELHQLLSAERSCQVSDMLLDFCGALVGMALAFAVLCLAKGRLRRG